ncbi:MAG: hypothetical protein R3E01_28295 [Pirellulaceae bacterium]|nr:hypothetical protein [Planctomycetales bacterium]
MPDRIGIERIRGMVRDTFRTMGNDDDVMWRETLLIREGTFCGHRFQLGDLQAVWFVEEDQIKFYGEDGTIDQVCKPSEELLSDAMPQRKAA